MWDDAYCHSIRTEAVFAEFSGGCYGQVWGSGARLNPALSLLQGNKESNKKQLIRMIIWRGK